MRSVIARLRAIGQDPEVLDMSVTRHEWARVYRNGQMLWLVVEGNVTWLGVADDTAEHYGALELLDQREGRA